MKPMAKPEPKESVTINSNAILDAIATGEMTHCDVIVYELIRRLIYRSDESPKVCRKSAAEIGRLAARGEKHVRSCMDNLIEAGYLVQAERKNSHDLRVFSLPDVVGKDRRLPRNPMSVDREVPRTSSSVAEECPRASTPDRAEIQARDVRNSRPDINKNKTKSLIPSVGSRSADAPRAPSPGVPEPTPPVPPPPPPLGSNPTISGIADYFAMLVGPVPEEALPELHASILYLLKTWDDTSVECAIRMAAARETRGWRDVMASVRSFVPRDDPNGNRLPTPDLSEMPRPGPWAFVKTPKPAPPEAPPKPTPAEARKAQQEREEESRRKIEALAAERGISMKSRPGRPNPSEIVPASSPEEALAQMKAHRLAMGLPAEMEPIIEPHPALALQEAP